MTTIEEMVERTIKTPTGCWEWQGQVVPAGYGRVQVGGRKSQWAHRVAYELVVGPIPKGLQIDHLCRNRRCVNPSHMEPVTPRENTMRGVSFAAINAKKTHCRRGHEFVAGSYRIVKNSKGRERACKECGRINAKTESVKAWRSEYYKERRRKKNAHILSALTATGRE